MPLRNFMKQFNVEPKTLWDSDLLTKFSKEATKPTYEMIKRVCKEFIETRNEDFSGGFFIFGILFGYKSTAPKKDVDRIRERMNEIFGNTKEANNYINRCLGTVLMATVAEDQRCWYYKDDPEKKVKLEDEEIPDPNQYFIGKEYKKPATKEIMSVEEAVKELSKRFRVVKKGN